MNKTILLRILFTFLLIHTTQYFKIRKAKIRVGARLIVWDTLLLVFFFSFFLKKITLPINGCAGKRSPNRTILRHNGGTICNADTWLKGWHSRRPASFQKRGCSGNEICTRVFVYLTSAQVVETSFHGDKAATLRR